MQPPQQAATPMEAFRAAEEAILAILGVEGEIPKWAARLISRQLSLISAAFALMANEVTVLKKSKVAYAGCGPCLPPRLTGRSRG